MRQAVALREGRETLGRNLSWPAAPCGPGPTQGLRSNQMLPTKTNHNNYPELHLKLPSFWFERWGPPHIAKNSIVWVKNPKLINQAFTFFVSRIDTQDRPRALVPCCRGHKLDEALVRDADRTSLDSVS